MTGRRFIKFAAGAFLLAACSNTRFLADDQLLYTGRKKIEILSHTTRKNEKEAKSEAKTITANKVNNAIAGIRMLPPVSLWIYNYAWPGKERGFGHWFHEYFSKPPILITDVNPELRAAKIQNDLVNRGFFHTTASASIDTASYNRKKAKVSYSVNLQPPWYLNKINYDTVTHPVDSVINATNIAELVKPGDRFDLSALQSIKTSMAEAAQEDGYFFFRPEYITIRADSGIGNRKMDIFLGRKENLDENLLSRYRINRITLHLVKTGGRDSALTDTFHYKDMVIVSPGKVLRPTVLYNSVAFRNGDLYSITDYRKTLNRLNNLGVFSLVNLYFDVPGKDTSSHLLDIRIETQVPKNLSLSVETNLVTKSTGFTGPALIAGVQHKNAFRGAEKIDLKLTGSMEWQWYRNYRSELGSYSYEAGATGSVVFPRIMLPGKKINEGNLVTKSTTLNGGISLLNRTAFYRLGSLRAGLSYQWGHTQKVHHTFSPLYLNFVKLLKTTPAFDSVVRNNIYIRRSFEQQFILGPRYEFSFDNKSPEKPGTFMFIGGVYTSGNLVSLLARKSGEEPARLFNAVYAQFFKFTADIRYYLNGNNQTLAFRLYSGVGLPYGNSSVLPYVEQFFSGGAYSIRGFPARRLGPGSYHDNTRGFIDQSGDIRLEMNVEYRMKFTKIIQGALFLETGNVWLRNNDPARPGAQFRANTFMNQLAAGTGLGLRFDLGFFVLRTDLGLPLRTPYTVNGSHHIGSFRDIMKKSVFNLAIGYPF
ncbi:MAG TPA: BamA/TamA family outer membrane protein [Bacteroidales bacterium]|nr:BamA/TamA family outer membrane protein [Bacteroidales bacterium]